MASSSRAICLKHYLDSLETLPLELHRNFNLMCDLDTRGQKELDTINELSQDFLNNIKNYGSEEKAAKMDDIHKLYKKAQAYADDKVQLSVQTCEMVDRHIRRLDADLARFEAELKEKALNLQSSDSEISPEKKGHKYRNKVEKKKGRHVVSSDDDTPKIQKKHKKDVLPSDFMQI